MDDFSDSERAAIATDDGTKSMAELQGDKSIFPTSADAVLQLEAGLPTLLSRRCRQRQLNWTAGEGASPQSFAAPTGSGSASLRKLGA